MILKEVDEMINQRIEASFQAKFQTLNYMCKLETIKLDRDLSDRMHKMHIGLKDHMAQELAKLNDQIQSISQLGKTGPNKPLPKLNMAIYQESSE